MMPPGGADARADQFEALERIQHDAPDRSRSSAACSTRSSRGRRRRTPTPTTCALIAVLKRDHHKAVSVPTELAAEISGASAHAQQSWLEAREKARLQALRARARAACSSSSSATSRASTARASSRTRTTSCSTTTSPASRPRSCAALFAHDPGGARPARLRGRGGGGGRPRLPGPLPGGGASKPFAEELLQRRRLRPRALAPGPVGAPVRAQHGAHGRAAHDALGGGRPRDGVLLLPARVRARALRGADVDPRHYRTTLADAAGLGVARVPEPAVGEPRRPLASRSASGSCRCMQRHLGGPFEAMGRRRALPRRQPGPALADPDRGRRDDVQPAHRAALRARAGAGRGAAERRRPARRLGRGDAPAARPRDAVA